ncbi:MAG: hypothetical protein KAJ23_10295 [Maribacter sp.]|nr:hypothetical protein [Maribacter sp.]
MSQYTLLKKNTNCQEFALPEFNTGCEFSAAPVRLFGIDQNNISGAGSVSFPELRPTKIRININFNF